MSTASLGMHKPEYLWVNSRISKINSVNQPKLMLWNDTMSSPGSLWASKGFKRKLKGICVIAALWVTGCQIHSSVSCWLHFLTWKIWYRYLYTKKYKAVNTYYRVFCYPESGNAKRGNVMVYGVNFMQCVWPDYWSWILCLPSFIINSCS